MTNLSLRIFTALVMGAIAVWFTWHGGAMFSAFSWFVGAAVLYEWNSLASGHINKISKIVGWVCYLVIGYALLFELPSNFIFLLIFLSFITVTLVARSGFLWAGGGLLYTAIPAASLSLTRAADFTGLTLIIFLFAVVWGTDVGAYFVGRALKGPKLIPLISPNKTWSGAIGGAILGVLCGIFTLNILTSCLPKLYIIVPLAFAMSVISQLGDIAESAIKRRFLVKDSSALLPGHGGFMDRVDGLICAVVLLYIVVSISSGKISFIGC